MFAIYKGMLYGAVCTSKKRYIFTRDLNKADSDFKKVDYNGDIRYEKKVDDNFTGIESIFTFNKYAVIIIDGTEYICSAIMKDLSKYTAEQSWGDIPVHLEYSGGNIPGWKREGYDLYVADLKLKQCNKFVEVKEYSYKNGTYYEESDVELGNVTKENVSLEHFIESEKKYQIDKL
jgi:hypothetical protein